VGVSLAGVVGVEGAGEGRGEGEGEERLEVVLAEEEDVPMATPIQSFLCMTSFFGAEAEGLLKDTSSRRSTIIRFGNILRKNKIKTPEAKLRLHPDIEARPASP
jgi:hypothetical protein